MSNVVVARLLGLLCLSVGGWKGLGWRRGEVNTLHNRQGEETAQSCSCNSDSRSNNNKRSEQKASVPTTTTATTRITIQTCSSAWAAPSPPRLLLATASACSGWLPLPQAKDDEHGEGRVEGERERGAEQKVALACTATKAQAKFCSAFLSSTPATALPLLHVPLSTILSHSLLTDAARVEEEEEEAAEFTCIQQQKNCAEEKQKIVIRTCVSLSLPLHVWVHLWVCVCVCVRVSNALWWRPVLPTWRRWRSQLNKAKYGKAQL